MKTGGLWDGVKVTLGFRSTSRAPRNQDKCCGQNQSESCDSVSGFNHNYSRLVLVASEPPGSPDVAVRTCGTITQPRVVFGSGKSKAVGCLRRESWGIVMMEITEGREHDNLSWINNCCCHHRNEP